MYLKYFFYPQIILLLIFSTITDLKEKKIYNLFIYTSLIFSLIINVIFLIFGSEFYSFYYTEYFISFLISSIIVIVFWKIRFLSAGDSKLFIALFSLMPPSIFVYNHVNNFYHLSLLFNVLLISFIYLFPDVVKKTTFKNLKKYLKGIFDPKFLLYASLFVYSISYFSQFIRKLLLIEQSNFFIDIFFLILLFLTLRKIFGKYFFKLVIGFSLFRFFILDFDQVFSFSYWSYFIILIFIFVVLRFIIIYLSYEVFTKEEKISDLKPGMVLAERIKINKEDNEVNIVKSQDFKLTLLNIFEEDFLKGYKSFEKEIGYEGKLNDESIKNIKYLKNNGKLKYSTFKVFEQMPFGHIMLISTLLSLIFEGDLVTSIILYFI
ncbi:MAG: prepilin peptidase [Candidatus Woesearchaeota archaeon]